MPRDMQALTVRFDSLGTRFAPTRLVRSKYGSERTARSHDHRIAARDRYPMQRYHQGQCFSLIVFRT